jgi:hypothetical protein
MLDYRAHKLYSLMSIPLRVFAKITYFAVIAASILVAQFTQRGPPIKIAVAYVAFEAISIVLLISVLIPLTWILKRFFFFLIDVVPAHGADSEEAKAIVFTGRSFELIKKFETEIENWTFADSAELASRSSWRARLFFPIRERLEGLATELRRIHAETGQQPRDLGKDAIVTIRNGLPKGRVTLFEKIVVTPQYYNSVFALTIVTIAIYYTSR